MKSGGLIKAVLGAVIFLCLLNVNLHARESVRVLFLPFEVHSEEELNYLALEIPILEPDLCTQCGKCPLVCPHAAIRCKIFPKTALENAPPTFKHMPTIGKGFPEGTHITYQVAPEDCTGCGLCVDICPIQDKENPQRKALNMHAQPPLREQERQHWEFFLTMLFSFPDRHFMLTTDSCKNFLSTSLPMM